MPITFLPYLWASRGIWLATVRDRVLGQTFYDNVGTPASVCKYINTTKFRGTGVLMD